MTNLFVLQRVGHKPTMDYNTVRTVHGLEPSSVSGEEEVLVLPTGVKLLIPPDTFECCGFGDKEVEGEVRRTVPNAPELSISSKLTPSGIRR